MDHYQGHGVVGPDKPHTLQAMRTEWEKRKLAIQVIEFLNEIIQLDPDVLTKLCEHRVTCTQELANHPTVQVEAFGTERAGAVHTVGLTGILNGFIGVQTDGWGYVAAVYGEEGRLERFMLAAAPEEREARRRDSAEDGGNPT